MSKHCLYTKLYTLGLLALLSTLILTSYTTSVKAVYYDTEIPEGVQHLNFNYGEIFGLNDTDDDVEVAFTVTSGSFKGNALVTYTGDGGTITIVPETNGALSYTANSTIYIYVNNAGPLTNLIYTAGQTTTITYTSTDPTIVRPTPVIIVDKGELNSTLFFRSDSHTVNGQAGYKLDTPNTDTPVELTNVLSGDVPVSYGFRVWLVGFDEESIELTDGTPVGIVTRSIDGNGIQSADWNMPQKSLDIGFDCLKIVVYLDISGSWIQRAVFISPTLLYRSIDAATWTFNLYTSKTTSGDTTAALQFGSENFESKISSVSLTSASWFELGYYQMLTGNIFGLIFGSYYSLFGPVAYLLMFLIPTGTLYARHRTTNVIVFLFAIAGGAPGTLIWVFVPAWAAAVVDIFLLLAGAFLVWKVTR